MSLIERRTRQQPRRIAIEDARELKAAVHRWTGLRLDTTLLENGEAHELLTLTRHDRLTVPQQATFERLTEKGCGRNGWFREQRAIAAKELAAEEQRLRAKKHPALVAAGTVQLPPILFHALQNRQMSATHFICIVLVIAALQNDAAVHPLMEVRDGAVILASPARLISALDLDGDVHRVSQAMRDLKEDGQWLQIEQHGSVTIRFGPLLADAMKVAA